MTNFRYLPVLFDFFGKVPYTILELADGCPRFQRHWGTVQKQRARLTGA